MFLIIWGEADTRMVSSLDIVIAVAVMPQVPLSCKSSGYLASDSSFLPSSQWTLVSSSQINDARMRVPKVNSKGDVSAGMSTYILITFPGACLTICLVSGWY